jgi:hypothetical protein
MDLQDYRAYRAYRECKVLGEHREPRANMLVGVLMVCRESSDHKDLLGTQEYRD